MYKRQSVAAITILLAGVLAVAGFAQQTARPAGTQDRTPDLNAILQRMEEARQENRLRARAYVMIRDYRLYGSTDEEPKSKVVAEISFTPPDEKTYRIERAEGNERGKNIVQRILNTEAEAAKNSQAALDRRNYDFSLEGEETVDGRPCWVLRLQPKREEKDLVDGHAWVDQNTYLVRRIDGEMAKNPSWWVKRVHATLTFGDISGMWMQTTTRAVADVRLIGRHTLVGEAVKVQTAEQVAYVSPQQGARNRVPRVVNRSRPASALGTGVLADH